MEYKKQDKMLNSLAKGASFIFLNSIIFYILRFFYKIIISRYLGPSDLGLLSLALMVFGVSTTLSLVGLNNGIIKYVSHYHGLLDHKRILGTIRGCLKISLVTSIITAFIVIIFSKFISNNIFHTPKLQPLLIIFAICIPLLNQTKLISKTFTAFKKPEINILTASFGREVSLLIFVSIAIFFGGNILNISIMYTLSFITSLILSLIILQKKIFPFITKAKAKYEYKGLLKYSLPLFLSAAFVEILGWADTFFIGIFLDTYNVGIYNIALSLATSLNIFLGTFAKISFPIISELKANNNRNQINNIFRTASRWGFLLSLPFFLLAIILPSQIISITFGGDYAAGSTAFSILIIAFFLNVITGPTTEVIKSFSKVNIIFWTSIFTAIFNIILNISLIPSFGLIGAALATTLSFSGREIFLFFYTKRLLNMRYNKKIYLKYLLCTIFPSFLVIFFSIKSKNSTNIFQLGIIAFCFLSLYLISIILTKSITKQDIEIITKFKKKIRKIFKRKYSIQ